MSASAYSPASSESRFSASQAYGQRQQSGSLPKPSSAYAQPFKPAANPSGSSSVGASSAYSNYQPASYNAAPRQDPSNNLQASQAKPAAKAQVQVEQPAVEASSAPAQEKVSAKAKARQPASSPLKSNSPSNDSSNSHDDDEEASVPDLNNSFAALSVSSASSSAAPSQGALPQDHTKANGKKLPAKKATVEPQPQQAQQAPLPQQAPQQTAQQQQKHQQDPFVYPGEESKSKKAGKAKKSAKAPSPPVVLDIDELLAPVAIAAPVDFDPAAERRNRREPQRAAPQPSPARVKAAPAKTRGTLPSFGGPAASVSASPYAKAGSAKVAAPHAPQPKRAAVPAPGPKKSGKRANSAEPASAQGDAPALHAHSSPSGSAPNTASPSPMAVERYRAPISPGHMVGPIYFEEMKYGKWNGCYVLDNILQDEKDTDCIICFESFAAGQTIATLPCMCRFHQKCIDNWFFEREKLKETQPRCPTHKDAIATAIIAGECYVGFLD